MNKQSMQKTPEQMIEAIFALDLDPIKFKLMDKKEGLGWTREKADWMELEYRRFLALSAKYPEEAIAPSTEVDKFWHGHILDTMKYAEDCQNVFGYFLHHFPYFGMRDAEDAASLAQAAAKTKRLYEQEFGACEAENPAYCARVGGSDGAATGTAYCARVAAADAAYCARVAAPAAEAAYCARVAATTVEKGDAAYCARVAAADAAYCARIADSASEADAGAEAYCARIGTTYLDTILAKGRPSLERASV